MPNTTTSRGEASVHGKNVFGDQRLLLTLRAYANACTCQRDSHILYCHLNAAISFVAMSQSDGMTAQAESTPVQSSPSLLFKVCHGGVTKVRFTLPFLSPHAIPVSFVDTVQYFHCSSFPCTFAVCQPVLSWSFSPFLFYRKLLSITATWELLRKMLPRRSRLPGARDSILQRKRGRKWRISSEYFCLCCSSPVKPSLTSPTHFHIVSIADANQSSMTANVVSAPVFTH